MKSNKEIGLKYQIGENGGSQFCFPSLKRRRYKLGDKRLSGQTSFLSDYLLLFPISFFLPGLSPSFSSQISFLSRSSPSSPSHRSPILLRFFSPLNPQSIISDSIPEPPPDFRDNDLALAYSSVFRSGCY